MLRLSNPVPSSASRPGWVYWVLVLLGATLDQALKFLAHAGVLSGLPFIGPVITISKNTGAAMSLFEGRNSLLAIATAVVIVGIVVYLAIGRCRERLMRLVLGLVLAGALGNLVDRVMFGHVRDFIDWPVFNVADIFICLGVAVSLYEGLRPKLADPSAPEGSDPKSS